ncbi:MAG: DUF4129 domain-containing protein [Chloroflexi bacterium]|nr:DUF4129 domain-containing protein [Chloroflexota bacterium]
MSAVETPPSTRPLLGVPIPLSKIWLHIQHELLYLSWGLTEAALFTPLSFSFLRWARYWPPGHILLWLLLVMFLSFNLARLMSLLDIPKSRQQSINAVALTLTILLSIRALIYAPQSPLDTSWLGEFFANAGEPGNSLWLRDIATFFLVVIMWQRGLRLVAREFEIEQAGFRLRLGIIVAPFAIWFSHVGLAWNATPFILLFFLAGLTMLSLIRAEELEQSRAGFSASLSPRWIGFIFTASLLTVTTAGLLAAIISGESLYTVAGWLAPLLSALHLGGAVILRTLAYLTQPLQILLALIIDRIAFWLERLFINTGINLQAQPTADFSDLMPTSAATDVVEVIAPPSVNTRIIAILLMVAVVLVVSLALGRLFRQATFAAKESETIGGKTEEEAETMGLGQRLLQRLGLWRRWRAAASVRRIYRQMLQAAADSGFPRGESETPFEFLNALAQVWPENTADSQLITQAFVKVRYGQLPETEEELEALEATWKRLQEIKPAPLEVKPHLET